MAFTYRIKSHILNVVQVVDYSLPTSSTITLIEGSHGAEIELFVSANRSVTTWYILLDRHSAAVAALAVFVIASTSAKKNNFFIVTRCWSSSELTKTTLYKM
jgi:hypothetical protein